MTIVELIFDHGVFRPTQPLSLPDGTRVSVNLPESEGLAPHRDKMRRFLEEIAALPCAPELQDGRSGARDHDAILYGKGEG